MKMTAYGLFSQQTPADIAQTFKKVKALGYDAVQLSELGPIDPAELKGILDDEGLTVCAIDNQKKIWTLATDIPLSRGQPSPEHYLNDYSSVL